MKTGNVKQVAAFGKLIGICNELGAGYNPSKEELKVNAMTSLLTQTQQSVEALRVARTNYTLAVNARQEFFAGIYTRASRVVRALVSSDGSPENIADVRLLKRKLIPKPKQKAKTARAPVAGQEVQPSISKSMSRLDFEGLTDTFAELITLLESIPTYAPNESELQIATLKAMLADLRMHSLNVANAFNAVATARINRNSLLAGNGGLLPTANAAKEYIRSAYGVRSGQSRELGKLRLMA